MLRIRIMVALSLALLSAAALPLAPAARAAGQALLVIVAASSTVRDISTAELRRCFQGLPTQAGGKKLVPINHPTSSPGRVAFDRAVLGLEPSAVGAFWIDRRIRDESPPPRTVPSAELALRIAASLPGAITYIAPELLNGTVKALTIDGKDLKSGGYLLK